jgi:nitrogen fixation-related uncharacterized protein
MLFIPFALIFMIGGIWFYWQIKNQPDYQNEGNNTKYLFKKRKRLKRKLGIIKYRLIKKWNARTEIPNYLFQKKQKLDKKEHCQSFNFCQ